VPAARSALRQRLVGVPLDLGEPVWVDEGLRSAPITMRRSPYGVSAADAPATERDLPSLVPMTDRDPVRVVLALRAHDVIRLPLP
jgi:hypothetical protein